MLVTADKFIQYVKEFDLDRKDLQAIFIQYNSINKLLPLKPFKTYVYFDEETEKILFARIPSEIDSTEEFLTVHTPYSEIQARLFH